MKIHNPKFIHYLNKNFPIHASKILKSSSRAWFYRLFYPLFFFLIPAVIFLSLAFFVYCIKDPSYLKFQNQARLAEFLQAIPLRNAMVSILLTGLCVSLFSFLIGLILGFSKANLILFEGEKLNISSKILWLLDDVTQTNKTLQTNKSDLEEPAV